MGNPMSGAGRAPLEPPRPRTRRSVMAAAAAAAGVFAVESIRRPAPVAAASVVLGSQNTATKATTIRSTNAGTSAKALVGVITQTGPGPSTAGVEGRSSAQGGAGVSGVANNGSGAKGVHGRSTSGMGVVGEAPGDAAENYGVYGVASAYPRQGGHGYGVYGLGISGGVYGRSPFGSGVHGEGDPGVSGSGYVGIAARGIAYGLLATTDEQGGTRYAVKAEANGSQFATRYGVHGTGQYGVFGIGNLSGGANYGVWGESDSATGYAGFFNGNVHVTGTLTQPAGIAVVDHPQAPADRTLAHAFVAAPEMLDLYRGVATLGRDGRATVRLPRYFESLNTTVGYQLTAIGTPAPELHVAQEIENGRFVIAGGGPGQKVSWVVTASRQDAWARSNPLRVDRAKSRRDRGRYLHPEAFGRPPSEAMHPTPEGS
jgi:hypothetical protein